MQTLQLPGVPEHFRLVDDYTEARVYSAMLLNVDDEREIFVDVETDDFYDPHLRYAFMALRNVEASGQRVGIGEVFAWLWERGYEGVDIAHVTQRVVLAPRYHTVEQMRRDAAWLRKLCHRRANEIAIAEREARRRGKR